MESIQQHRIRSVTFDFQYHGKTNVYDLQSEVRDWVDACVINLDEVLNTITDQEKFIAIESLVIDVNSNTRNWKQEVNWQIARQLQDRISQLQQGISSAQNTETTSKQSFEAIFLYFLAHGYLPWNAVSTTSNEWRQQVEQLFIEPAFSFISILFGLLNNSAVYRQRFINSLPASSFPSVMQPLFSDGADKAFLQDIENLLLQLPTVQRQEIQLELLEAIVAGNFQAGRPSTKTKLVEVIVPLVAPGSLLLKTIQNMVFTSETMKTVQTETKTGTSKKESQQPASIPSMEEKAPASKTPVTTYMEGLFVSNAGLIIVAPFLPVFFEKLDILQAFQITNHSKAVCLLHYLCTGSNSSEEFELVLPKILCGLSPEKFVDTRIELDEQLTGEADELLRSIIEHWSILQNTSVDGLRETFLQREGKLSFSSEGWKLEVARGSFDMLLDQLPWNISMIKHSWMPDMLRTEWN